MKKRNAYGQHFLKSAIIAKNIVSSAEITKNDTVFELGTGHGILIPYLCEKAKNVISIETDKKLYLSHQFCKFFTKFNLFNNRCYKII